MNPLDQDRLRLIKLPWILAIIALVFVAALAIAFFGWGAHAREWLNLIVRWLHIIYGIAWIGASFYFIFLENALERQNVRDELAGNIWTIHGGGIYYLEKYKVAPKTLPPYLHWFKWDAYLTWVTGFLLLIIVYYSDPRATLLNANSSISAPVAIAIAAGSLVATWFVYVLLSRTPLLKRPDLFLLVAFILIGLAAWGLSQIFSGRGTFIHIGAMLGTIMAGNVFFVIIPSQKALIKAAQAGNALDVEFVKWVQLRSRHNNYITLPVLFTMISNHFPFTYAHGLNWLILLLLFVAGVAVRHFINVTEKEHHKTLVEGGAMPYLLVLAFAFILGAFYLTAPQTTTVAISPDAPQVTFAQAQQVFNTRCIACHATKPTQPGFASPPAGVMLEHPEQISALVAKIKQVAVDSEYMPPGNLTQITPEERQLLATWIAQGAKLE